jgi:hypothetical protein
MTPEVRQIELEEFEPFSDMRLTPTEGWNVIAHREFKETHPMVRFYFIAREHGINFRPRKLTAAEARERFLQRLKVASHKLSQLSI